MKSLAKDPADRYQSARDMHDDIARVLAGEAVAAPPAPPASPGVSPAPGDVAVGESVPPVPPPAWQPERSAARRRPSASTVVLGILLAALIGVLVFALYEFNRPSRPTAVQVPGVISYTQQRAEQQLKDSDLSPVVQTTTGPADTQGQVISQNPTAQATVTPGADVTIVVNLGPKTAQIPTGLTGLSAKDATDPPQGRPASRSISSTRRRRRRRRRRTRR